MALLTFIMPDAFGWFKIIITAVFAIALVVVFICTARETSKILDERSKTRNDHMREEEREYIEIMEAIGFTEHWGNWGDPNNTQACFFHPCYRGCRVKIYFTLGKANRPFAVYAYDGSERYVSRMFSLVELIALHEVENEKAVDEKNLNLVRGYLVQQAVNGVVDKFIMNIRNNLGGFGNDGFNVAANGAVGNDNDKF